MTPLKSYDIQQIDFGKDVVKSRRMIIASFHLPKYKLITHPNSLHFQFYNYVYTHCCYSIGTHSSNDIVVAENNVVEGGRDVVFRGRCGYWINYLSLSFVCTEETEKRFE